jgi:hypothetical protein
MTRPLDGAVALVTGASQGIGQGIALELGEQGAMPPEVRLLVDHLGDGNVPDYWRLVERFGRGFAEPSPA